MNYNIKDHIDTIYNDVEDLVEVRELAGRPFSPEQIIDLAYMIISKYRIFRDDIRAWMRRPQSEKYG